MIDIAHIEADNALARMSRDISRVYDSAIRGMLKKQERFMAGYDAEYPGMQKLVEKNIITEGEFIDWVREQAIKERWYGEMLNTLAIDAVNADQIAMNVINGYTPGIYANNYNWGTYTIEKGTGIDTMFTMYDRATVERLWREDPDLLPRAGLNVTKDLTWNRQKFNSAITQGILQGESMDDIQARLVRVMGMDENSAMRCARTATTSAENGGRIDSYKRAEAMGIDLKKEWIATLDSRTRHSHRQLDRVSIPLDDGFDNGCAFPGDPAGPIFETANCRCTLIADIADVDLGDARRFSRLAGVDYQTWRDMKGKPVTPAQQRKAKEDAPNRPMMRHSRKELSGMDRDALVEMARAIYVRRCMEEGIPKAEAERRFRLLIDAQTTPQLRQYVLRYQ